MKIRNFLSAMVLLLAGSTLLFHVHSCTHEDVMDLDIDPAQFEYGSDEISAEQSWSFDKSHSSVRWETAYLGSSALLTGRFNAFDIEMTFDEDDPENTTIIGKVTLSSVNTGEPGRDGGCLQGTLGVEERDEAIFTSRSVTFDNAGAYLVVGDLDFHGRTDEVTMQLTYLGKTLFDESSGLFGAPFAVAGFEGEFEFNAKSVFGIESTNVADRIVIKINAQYKKPGG